MIQDKRLPLKEAFLSYYRQLPIQKAAAAFIKRNEDTIRNWREEDEDFSREVELAKAEFVRTRSIKTAPEWILERVSNEFFKSPKQEVDATINIRWNDGDNNTVPSNATPETTTPSNS